MNYGPIEDVVLLGGGTLLREICLWATSEGAPVKVITAPRHARETAEGLSLEDFLVQNAIDHIVTASIDTSEVRRFVGTTERSFCLSLGAAWIFKSDVLGSIFSNGLLNLHGTRLPQNRGGGGFSWQIMSGNRFGVCLLHLVDAGVDTGDIVDFREFLYPPKCRKPVDYETVYRSENLDFVIDFIERHRSGTAILKTVPQQEYLSSYFPRLNTKLNGWIDWTMEASDIERFICAFDDPYDGAQTLLNDEIVHLKSVSLSPQDGVFHPHQTGIVYRKGPSWLCVCLKGSTLIVEEVRDSDANNCFDRIRVGDRFFTPSQRLEEALKRPTYIPSGLK